MENNVYKEIYAKTLLNEIKNRVTQNGMKLKGENEVDKQMIEVIKDLCVKTKDDYQVKVLPVNSKEDNERIICTLIEYYAALYNDNVKLLNELLDNGYNFGNKRYDLNIFALDKRISNNFDKELYFKLLKNQTSVFKNFYNSLYDEKINIKDEDAIKSFCNILNRDNNVAFCKEEGYFRGERIHNILTKKSIAYFGEDIIINASEKQKRNIISKVDDCSKEEINRIIKLMQEHNYDTYSTLDWKETLKQFTDEELIKINAHEESLFYKHYNHQLHKVDYDKIRDDINVIQKKKTKNFFRR